jgi:iron complex outermembrane receptor protein
MKKKTISSLIGLLLSTSAYSATTMISADDVVVTASRIHENVQNIPANVQVITREQINELSPSSIPQVLSQLGGLNVSGVALGQFNRGANVDIGGYGANASSTTLVLINGQRISPIDSSAVPWEMIAVSAIDRIEIIKGSAGVLYGDRAVGGVINIVTNEGKKSINQASVTFGSFGTKGLSAIFQNKFNDTLFKISGNVNESDGWRQNTASNQYSFNARVTQFFDKNSAYVETFANHNKNETPGAVTGTVGEGNPRLAKCDIYNCFKGAHNKFDNFGVALGGQYDFSEHVRFETDFSYKNTQSDFYKNGDNTFITGGLSNPPLYFPYSADYNRWRIDFSPRLRFDFEKLGKLILGYDYGRAIGATSDSFSSQSNAALVDNSLYVNYRLPVRDNLDFSAGFRRQVESISARSFDGTSLGTEQKSVSANAWEVGVNYKFSDAEKLYVKYGQSFRFPNIDEFWGYDDSYNVTFAGIITPQIDRTIEIGSNVVLGNTKITTSAFYTRTNDQIRFQVATGKNINDPNLIERKGIYLSTDSSITNRLSLHTNSKLQDATYADGPYKGKSHDLVPSLLINARLNYKFDHDWSLGLVTNYIGSQYYDGANDNAEYKKMPSYLVTDLYASKKIQQWDIRLTIRNIANEQYATYGGYQDKGDGGAYFYKGYYYYSSDPRSVFASVSYGF